MVNLAILTTGMSLGWSSPMLVKLQSPTETPLQTLVTDHEGSWIVSAGFLLSAIFNFPAGLLLDVIGRKYCILLASLTKLCMALMLIFAKKVWLVILSRTIMNTVDSVIMTIVPIYASEIANKEHRGALGTFLQLFCSLGVVISLSVGPFMSYNVFSIFFTSIIAVTTVPLFFLPDTPFYLYSKDRPDEAIKVLSLIRGSDIIVKQELEEYKVSTESKKNTDNTVLFKNKTFLKSLLLAVLLISGSQLVGFNAVSFYLQTILQSTNTSVMPEVASVIIGVIQLIGGLSATLVMRFFMRKTIMLTSLAGILLGMLGLGSFFQVRNSKANEFTGFMNYMPIISLILVIYSYSVGIGSLVWLVIAELFDGPGRALGVSICVCFSSLIIFLTTKYFALMTLAMGPAVTYWFFSSMCVLVFIVIVLFIPETKGKTFNEIQTELGEKTDIQNTVKNVNIKT